MDFFMGSANAPRRALGRQNATFSLVTPHWSGVYAAKRPRIIAENTAKIAKKATRRAWRRRSLDFYGISQASPATREARCAPLRACAPRVTSGLRLGAGCAAGRRTHSRRLRSQSRRPVANNGRQRRPVHHNHNSNIKVNPTSAFLGITHQAQHHHIGIVPVSGALCRLSLHQKELHRVRELRRVTRVRLQKRGC